MAVVEETGGFFGTVKRRQLPHRKHSMPVNTLEDKVFEAAKMRISSSFGGWPMLV